MIRLLQDDPQRKRMGTAGREMVQDNYEWETVLDECVFMYERALDMAGVMV